MSNLTITKKKGESKKDAYARTMLSPNVGSAATSEYFSSGMGGKKEQNLNATISEIGSRIDKVKNGDMSDIEATLVSQSITLDMIFNELATRSFLNMGNSTKITETYMRMALKAQSQCRCTIEALNEMKNPKSITITKQANISEQQIVNNGTMNTGSTHAGEKQNESNELLEVVEHDKVDTRTKGETIKSNQKVEAVGAIIRSKD